MLLLFIKITYKPVRVTAALTEACVWKHCSGVPGCLQTSGTGTGNSQSIGQENFRKANNDVFVQGYLPGLFAWELDIEGVTLLLGGWWLETSARGELEVIPVINIDPEMGYLDQESGNWIWDDMERAREIAVEEELLYKQKLAREKDEEEASVANAYEKLEDIEDETDQVEEIMKKALANMQKTQTHTQTLPF